VSRVRLPGRSALLLIDVVNPFDFSTGDRLLRRALPAAPKIRALKHRASRAGIPTIYVNDNYGDWHANFAELVSRCAGRAARGRRFVEQVAPGPDDYYVLKPLHSGFHSTSLDVLLEKLDVETVVLVGVAAHICVFFTAMDAYMRGLEVVVPRDCVVSADARQTRRAIAQLEDAIKARIVRSDSVAFERAPRRARSPRRRSRVPGAASDQVQPRRA
jgi:nicotinamidase-related amidase